MLWPSPPWDRVVYWALDLETGGLDPRTDAILSAGMVPIRAGAVRLGEAFSTLVRPERADRVDPGSVRAHQLVPDDVRGAPGLDEVLARVDERLREGALLVHQAALDVAFLKRAYRRAGRRWPSPPVVDTVALLLAAAKRARLIDPGAPDQEPELNLLAARRRLGLPDYGQHDALTDAIATAELFLVLRRRLAARTLRDLR
ncbi:3'-5' exonuclease [Anaeromyxobacter oryzisoli]|uniref:3'-5' exonuclease n=1 Tax=Anaeromyxobacter oryzisoli TaxID=2925408 RepID=UPI001F55B7B1|nr:3'-5' exonuclease [Anaeromyxobacter sp. SG63]